MLLVFVLFKDVLLQNVQGVQNRLWTAVGGPARREQLVVVDDGLVGHQARVVLAVVRSEYI